MDMLLLRNVDIRMFFLHSVLTQTRSVIFIVKYITDSDFLVLWKSQ